MNIVRYTTKYKYALFDQTGS